MRRYLRRHGLEARRSLSQNHLVDGEALEAIVEAAAPAPGRRVLEVGPGIGILTGALLAAGAAVTAVEVDARLAAHLRERFELALELGAAHPDAPAGSLTLVEADVLDVPVDELVSGPFDVVANLPYHITSPVLHHVLGDEPRPERFVLMLQREVAERIASPPGGMSYLSVFVQYHADGRSVVRIVPGGVVRTRTRGRFGRARRRARRPRRLTARKGRSALAARPGRLPRAAQDDQERVPRQLPALGRERVDAALDAAGIAPDRRPQTLSVEEWLVLAELLDMIGPGWRTPGAA